MTISKLGMIAYFGLVGLGIFLAIPIIVLQIVALIIAIALIANN